MLVSFRPLPCCSCALPVVAIPMTLGYLVVDLTPCRFHCSQHRVGSRIVCQSGVCTQGARRTTSTASQRRRCLRGSRLRCLCCQGTTGLRRPRARSATRIASPAVSSLGTLGQSAGVGRAKLRRRAHNGQQSAETLRECNPHDLRHQHQHNTSPDAPGA